MFKVFAYRSRELPKRRNVVANCLLELKSRRKCVIAVE
jgi:hypothetical protein